MEKIEIINQKRINILNNDNKNNNNIINNNINKESRNMNNINLNLNFNSGNLEPLNEKYNKINKSDNIVSYKPQLMNSSNSYNSNNKKMNSHTKLSMNSNFIKKPSAKFTRVSSDPFSVNKKQKSNFVYVYSAGGIPCRIEHGTVRLRLNWLVPPSSNK